jgi:hypothetical protein
MYIYALVRILFTDMGRHDYYRIWQAASDDRTLVSDSEILVSFLNTSSVQQASNNRPTRTALYAFNLDRGGSPSDFWPDLYFSKSFNLKF